MTSRPTPDFATLAEAPVHQARRQFLANQFARSVPDARPAATDGSPPAPGRLGRFTFAAGRLLLGVAALTFVAWALLDAWTLPIVEHSWPSGQCVAVEPDPWTCEQLPPRYTTTWVSPEAGR